jgi:outer membrane translocation and assembly module TamA
MLARRLLSVAPVLLTCIPCALGQLPKKLEKCLPYPTLAQEIQERQPEPEPARVRVHVIRVVFDSNDGIPADAQQEISEELRSHVFEPEADSPYLKDLANVIAEVPVREAFRNRGYFKINAKAKMTELWTEGADISAAVAINVTPGAQYRTGDIRIESADPDRPLTISPKTLRALIPLQKGELFNVERVRTGLENLGRVYGQEGYIDMTPEPETQVDDDRGTIDLVVKIDQQAQYRVGSIEFLGVDSMTREKLSESLPKPGELFDSTKLNEFFKVNRAILPSDVSSDDVSVRRDNKARTVAILFDLWTCPSSSN